MKSTRYHDGLTAMAASNSAAGTEAKTAHRLLTFLEMPRSARVGGLEIGSRWELIFLFGLPAGAFGILARISPSRRSMRIRSSSASSITIKMPVAVFKHCKRLPCCGNIRRICATFDKRRNAVDKCLFVHL